MDSGFGTVDAIEDDQGINFEVSKVEVNVDRVESDEEIGESLLLGGRDVSEEGRGDSLTCRERLANRDVKGESLGIDITDIDTTFVCEEDRVTLTGGGDADVVFSV